MLYGIFFSLTCPDDAHATMVHSGLCHIRVNLRFSQKSCWLGWPTCFFPVDHFWSLFVPRLYLPLHITVWSLQFMNLSHIFFCIEATILWSSVKLGSKTCLAMARQWGRQPKGTQEQARSCCSWNKDGESRWRWLIMRRTVKGKEKDGKRGKKEK